MEVTWLFLLVLCPNCFFFWLLNVEHMDELPGMWQSVGPLIKFKRIGQLVCFWDTQESKSWLVHSLNADFSESFFLRNLDALTFCEQSSDLYWVIYALKCLRQCILPRNFSNMDYNEFVLSCNVVHIYTECSLLFLFLCFFSPFFLPCFVLNKYFSFRSEDVKRQACLILKIRMLVPNTLEQLFKNNSSYVKITPVRLSRSQGL